jgi:hypothetical protein
MLGVLAASASSSGGAVAVAAALAVVVPRSDLVTRHLHLLLGVGEMTDALEREAHRQIGLA